MRIDRRNDLDLRLIEAFAAVIEQGTTTAAAEHLGLSQSAVWNAIRTFEAQLDVTLFERKGRRLEPTQYGLLVYQDLRPLRGVLDSLAGRLKSLKHQRRGKLSVVATAPIGHVILPAALNRLLSQHTEIEVEIEIRPPHQVDRAVQSGLADIGLRMGPIQNEGLHTRILGHAELVTVMPRDHLLTSRTVVGPSDLNKDRLISSGPTLAPLVEGAFALQGMHYEPSLHCDQAQSACALVNAGLGVSVVDPYSASLFSNSALVTRKFSPQTRVAVVAMSPPDSGLDEPTAKLIASLMAVTAALAPAGWG